MTYIHSMEISYGNMTMLTAHGNWLQAHYSQSIRLEITAIQSRFLDTFLEGKNAIFICVQANATS